MVMLMTKAQSDELQVALLQSKIHGLELAIRSAVCLDELRRIVGPGEEEELESKSRLATIDRYFERYGYVEDWPDSAKKVWEKQEEYEARYC